MVLFTLCIKADLAGVASVALANEANLCISVRNPQNDFEVREKVVLDANELEAPGYVGGSLRGLDSEPPCHFAIKWDGALKRSTVRVVDLSELQSKNKKGSKESAGLPREMTDKDSGKFVPVLALECQGLEPYDFHPMGEEFVVTSSNSAESVLTKFEKVDLANGEWSGYELASGSCSITNFQAKFM